MGEDAPSVRHGPATRVTGWAALARDAGRGLLDLAWPPQCCSCGEPGDLFFCNACRQLITPIEPPCCPACGHPDVRTRCPDCGEAPWLRQDACDAMRQVALFSGVWRDIIHRYKFDGMRVLADELSGYLTDWLDGAAAVWREVDCVAPVPGHFTRRWRLGYEHSHLLALRVAHHLGVPLVQPVRRLRGKSQVGLTREERMENAKRIYAPKRGAPSLSGRRVLLVDDVVTTGATVRAVSALLKTAGASRVRAIALARNT